MTRHTADMAGLLKISLLPKGRRQVRQPADISVGAWASL